MKIEKLLCKLKVKKSGLFFIKRCIGRKEILTLHRDGCFGYIANDEYIYVNVKEPYLKFLPKNSLNVNLIPVYSDNLLILKVLVDYLNEKYIKENDHKNKYRNKNKFVIVNKTTGKTVYQK